MAAIKTKAKLTDLTMEELLQYEKATTIICSRIEKASRTYDGRVVGNTEEFDKYMKFYNQIIDEIKNRLTNIA